MDISQTDPEHPDALALIAGSEAEQSAIYPPEVRNAFSPEQLRASGTLFFVLRVGGAPVACGGVAPCDGYGELKRIFVTPEARGSGAAQAIVGRLEEEARRLGLPAMRLETGEASPAALKLYERLGYRRRGPFGGYVDNGSSVFMEKPLSGRLSGR